MKNTDIININGIDYRLVPVTQERLPADAVKKCTDALKLIYVGGADYDKDADTWAKIAYISEYGMEDVDIDTVFTDAEWDEIKRLFLVIRDGDFEIADDEEEFVEALEGAMREMDMDDPDYWVTK